MFISHLKQFQLNSNTKKMNLKPDIISFFHYTNTKVALQIFIGSMCDTENGVVVYLYI